VRLLPKIALATAASAESYSFKSYGNILDSWIMLAAKCNKLSRIHYNLHPPISVPTNFFNLKK